MGVFVDIELNQSELIILRENVSLYTGKALITTDWTDGYTVAHKMPAFNYVREFYAPHVDDHSA